MGRPLGLLGGLAALALVLAPGPARCEEPSGPDFEKTPRARLARVSGRYPWWGGARSAAFSPDGRLLATGFDDTVVLRDVARGDAVATLESHSGAVHALAFSPDGKRVASAGEDGWVRIFDARGDETASFSTGEPTTALAFLDVRRIASGGVGGRWRVFDLERKHELRAITAHEGRVNVLLVDRLRGLLLSGGEDQAIRAWNPESGERLFSLEGHEGPLRSLALSRDGQRLLSGSRHQTLWDLATKKPVWSFEERAAVVLVRFHADESHALADSVEGLSLVELSSGRKSRVLVSDPEATILGDDPRLLESDVPALALSLDQRWFFDGTEVVDLEKGKSLRALAGHTGSVRSVAFSRDGKALVSGGEDGTIRVWGPDGAAVRTLGGDHAARLNEVAISSDGRVALSREDDGFACGTCGDSPDRPLKLWDLSTGVAHGGEGATNVRSLALSPDAKLALVGERGRLVLRTLPGLAVVREVDAGDAGATGVAFSPSGELFAAGGSDGKVRLFSRNAAQATSALDRHAEGSAVGALAFSPAGDLLASGSQDGTIAITVTRDGSPGVKLAREGPVHHARGVHAVAFSPDGKLLASSGGDGFIRVFDVATGRRVDAISLESSMDEALSLAFAPAACTLVAGTERGVVLWFELGPGNDK